MKRVGVVPAGGGCGGGTEEAETKTLLKEVKEEEEEDRTEEDAWAVVMSLMDGGAENIRRQRETRAKECCGDCVRMRCPGTPIGPIN